jgi:hypothetical protein
MLARPFRLTRVVKRRHAYRRRPTASKLSTPIKASQNPVSNILIKHYTKNWTVSITMLFNKTNSLLAKDKKAPVPFIGAVVLAGDGLNSLPLLSNIALSSTFMHSNASSISSVCSIQEISEVDDDAFENMNEKNKNEQNEQNKRNKQVVDDAVVVDDDVVVVDVDAVPLQIVSCDNAKVKPILKKIVSCGWKRTKSIPSLKKHLKPTNQVLSPARTADYTMKLRQVVTCSSSDEKDVFPVLRFDSSYRKKSCPYYFLKDNKKGYRVIPEKTMKVYLSKNQPVQQRPPKISFNPEVLVKTIADKDDPVRMQQWGYWEYCLNVHCNKVQLNKEDLLGCAWLEKFRKVVLPQLLKGEHVLRPTITVVKTSPCPCPEEENYFKVSGNHLVPIDDAFVDSPIFAAIHVCNQCLQQGIALISRAVQCPTLRGFFS